jgi:hypothetical protein
MTTIDRNNDKATGFDKTNRRTAHVGKKIEWDVPNIAISAIT